MSCVCMFFFKQKTAYEMRISDWSSDVCSSDRFGPLKTMKNELIEGLARNLGRDDILIMPDPAYFGGTVTREVGSEDIVEGVRRLGRTALHIPDRAACGDMLIERVRPGDRIIIMGARDDTLSEFARTLVDRLRAAASKP